MFLVAISYFIMGSSSGITNASMVFDTPFLGLNYAPFTEIPMGKDDLYIQKKVIDENNKIIPFKDLMDNNYDNIYDGRFMKENYGLSYLDNEPGEILSGVKDMEEKLSLKKSNDSQRETLIQRYLTEFLPTNKRTDAKTEVCYSWLKNNKELYLD